MEEGRLGEPVGRRLGKGAAILFLVGLAWKALSGGFGQAKRARTLGQKVQTVAQIQCGGLSLLAALPCLGRRGWVGPVRTLWRVSLIVASGLSGLVWGPPMPHIAILFAGVAGGVARGVDRLLGDASDRSFRGVFKNGG